MKTITLLNDAMKTERTRPDSYRVRRNKRSFFDMLWIAIRLGSKKNELNFVPVTIIATKN